MDPQPQPVTPDDDEGTAGSIDRAQGRFIMRAGSLRRWCRSDRLEWSCGKNCFGNLPRPGMGRCCRSSDPAALVPAPGAEQLKPVWDWRTLHVVEPRVKGNDLSSGRTEDRLDRTDELLGRYDFHFRFIAGRFVVQRRYGGGRCGELTMWMPTPRQGSSRRFSSDTGI